MSLHPLLRKFCRLLPELAPLAFTWALALVLAGSFFVLLGTGAPSTAKAVDAATGIWEPLGGPLAADGQVNALVVERNTTVAAQGVAGSAGVALQPDTLYALVGSPGGGENTKVFKSTDSAVSWTPVYSPTASARLLAVDAVGQSVYVAGDSNGRDRDCIFQSQDGGASWTSVFNSNSDNFRFSAIAINPLTRTTTYAAGRMDINGFNGSVIYLTNDNGLNWTDVFSVADAGGYADLLTLAVNPVTPTTLFAAGTSHDRGVIYRSTDSGVSWTHVYTAGDVGAWAPVSRITSLLIDPLTPTVIFAGSGLGPNVVYRSNDDGNTWDLVDTRFNWGGYGLAFQTPNTFYASGDGGDVYVSTAGGISSTWSLVGSTLVRNTVLAGGQNALYAGGQSRGLLKSVDGGATWVEANNGILSAPQIKSISIDPGNAASILLGTYPLGWMTPNGGQTWTQPSGGGWPDWSTPPSMYFAMNPVASNIVYAGIGSCHQGNVLRSQDGGITFTPVYTSTLINDCNTGDEFIAALAVAPSLSSTVYAVGRDRPFDASQPYGVIVRSQGNGLSGTWSEVFTQTDVEFGVVSIDPVNEANTYVGGSECTNSGCTGVLYHTTNAGLNWTKVLTDNKTVRSIVIDPQKPSVLYVATDEYRVYKSADSGATWTIVRRSPGEPGGEASGNQLAIDPHTPSYVYLGGWGYIAETTDGGSTWSDWNAPINQGTPQQQPTALVVNNTGVTQTLYAGFSGLWHYVRSAPQPGAPMTLTLVVDAVPVRSSSASMLPLASNGITVTTGTAITLTTLVVDKEENWVADGTIVTFASPGFFMTTTVPIANGQAMAQVTMLQPGAATISASSGAASAAVTVTVANTKMFLPTIRQN